MINAPEHLVRLVLDMLDEGYVPDDLVEVYITTVESEGD